MSIIVCYTMNTKIRNPSMCNLPIICFCIHCALHDCHTYKCMTVHYLCICSHGCPSGSPQEVLQYPWLKNRTVLFSTVWLDPDCCPFSENKSACQFDVLIVLCWLLTCRHRGLDALDHWMFQQRLQIDCYWSRTLLVPLFLELQA